MRKCFPFSVAWPGFAVVKSFAAGALVLAAGVFPARAATIVTLDSFNGTNGTFPVAALIADAAGNLFGTTQNGWTSNAGTVFEIVNTGGSYGSPVTLTKFTGSNGTNPTSVLLIDSAGNLFGTTYAGGASNKGTVWEIAKTGSSYSSPTTLASFSGSGNGMNPIDGLLVDAAGNLFGTTSGGGSSGVGTIFELPKSGSLYGSLSTLLTFTGSNGSNPHGGLIADAAGNLFGTTIGGGTSNDGIVFELPKSGSSFGSLLTLGTFSGSNGIAPYAMLTADSAGNLFGTTLSGGASSHGTVFELAKSGSSYGSLTTIASFTGSNGADPLAGLLIDGAGSLFGTTWHGGTSNVGTVFEIAKTGSTYGSIAVLASFNGTNGSVPYGTLIADAGGNLFGTTSGGGANSDGTVFELTSSGFVTAQANTNAPEPASIALLGVGTVVIGLVRRRRRV